MAVSCFDLFSIGIGPSSSHTVGPMRAARRFLVGLDQEQQLATTHRLRVELYGSLALTGRGHGTDRAVIMGLLGEEPETVNPRSVAERVEEVQANGRIALLGRHEVDFVPERDLRFEKRRSLPYHPNGMRFRAANAASETLRERIYYSVGGGFVVNEDTASEDKIVADATSLPHRFRTGADLLRICAGESWPIWRVMLENEKAWRSEEEIRSGLLELAEAMHQSVEAGCTHRGVLPGSLQVRRRAARLLDDLESRSQQEPLDPLTILDWVSLFAIAVNEENAAGGRVVTAPTNGAAGILPAVLEYYRRFLPGADDDGIVRFLLTAAAVGILFKENASISGAEVGCQGEVGVACSMAAAGLAELLGGDPVQVENAAEIGMEHHLGLTCDPVDGLVQIPCIERNAMGAVKAINAARLAVRGDGSHKVSLDKVIKTMRETGADMKRKYKETSRGGLAINVIEC